MVCIIMVGGCCLRSLLSLAPWACVLVVVMEISHAQARLNFADEIKAVLQGVQTSSTDSLVANVEPTPQKSNPFFVRG